MRRVRIHAAASEEAAEAAAWYEEERPGLGAEFESAIEAALDLLETEMVPLVVVPGAAGTRGVKRLLLRRFPFAVIVRKLRLRRNCSSTESLTPCRPSRQIDPSIPPGCVVIEHGRRPAPIGSIAVCQCVMVGAS